MLASLLSEGWRAEEGRRRGERRGDEGMVEEFCSDAGCVGGEFYVLVLTLLSSDTRGSTSSFDSSLDLPRSGRLFELSSLPVHRSRYLSFLPRFLRRFRSFFDCLYYVCALSFISKDLQAKNPRLVLDDRPSFRIQPRHQADLSFDSASSFPTFNPPPPPLPSHAPPPLSPLSTHSHVRAHPQHHHHYQHPSLSYRLDLFLPSRSRL